MKRKISVSVDEATLDQLNTLLGSGSFRNRSHFVEYALTYFINSKEGKK